MDFLEETESEHIHKCVYVRRYYHKVCFVGPKDNALTIFLFVALLSPLHFFFFSSRHITRKKEQALKVPLVFLCVFEYYKVL